LQLAQTLNRFPSWDTKPVIRRVVRWVDAVRKGKADRKIINYPAAASARCGRGESWPANHPKGNMSIMVSAPGPTYVS
jgi:hypothetical protein